MYGGFRWAVVVIHSDMRREQNSRWVDDEGGSQTRDAGNRPRTQCAYPCSYNPIKLCPGLPLLGCSVAFFLVQPNISISVPQTCNIVALPLDWFVRQQCQDQTHSFKALKEMAGRSMISDRTIVYNVSKAVEVSLVEETLAKTTQAIRVGTHHFSTHPAEEFR